MQLIEKALSNIPIIQLRSVPQNQVYCLMEKFNLTGSVKVKTVYWMLKTALEQQKLDKSKIVIEASSGNTAIALSYFSKIFDLKVHILLPKSTASCKKKLMESFGAEYEEIDGTTDDCIVYRDEIVMANPDKYFLPDQFKNYANMEAHYNLTGPHIYKNVGDLDFFGAGLGTSGTLLGVGKYLKEKNPKTKIVAVNPIQKVEGLRNFHSTNTHIPFYDKYKNLIDEYIDVDFDDAIEGVDDFLREGYFNGISSGACLSGIKKYCSDKKGLKGVMIAPDGGDYYFETLVKHIDLQNYRGCK